MSDIILDAGPDFVSVVAPPETIRVSYEIGQTGQRGSMWFTGNGLPGPATLPDLDFNVYDLYLDGTTGNLYQYILLPSNVGDWAYVGNVGGGPAGSIPVVMGDQQPTGPALWVDTTGGNLTLNIVTEN